MTMASSFPTVGLLRTRKGPPKRTRRSTEHAHNVDTNQHAAALDYEGPINCEVPRLSFTLALRRTGASGQNVGKISFFAIKLSTREHSATFHD